MTRRALALHSRAFGALRDRDGRPETSREESNRSRGLSASAVLAGRRCGGASAADGWRREGGGRGVDASRHGGRQQGGGGPEPKKNVKKREHLRGEKVFQFLP